MWARVPVPARLREQDGAAASGGLCGVSRGGAGSLPPPGCLFCGSLCSSVFPLRSDGDHLLTWSTQKLQPPTFPELTCGAQSAGQASSPCIPPPRNGFLGLPLHFLLLSAYQLNKPPLPVARVLVLSAFAISRIYQAPLCILADPPIGADENSPHWPGKVASWRLRLRQASRGFSPAWLSWAQHQ